MTTGSDKCSVPPEGWYCTRSPGHEGPCAALPVEKPKKSKEHKIVCGKLPAPWRCSNESGHTGPCTATRDPKVSEKEPHIECKTYTDFKLEYGLYKEQSEAIQDWIKKHDEARHIKKGQKFRYSGAIGGAYTIEFTGTSIGTCVGVRCCCGESANFTDYDNW